MSTLSLRLPESLHKKIRELASEEGVSINNPSLSGKCRACEAEGVVASANTPTPLRGEPPEKDGQWQSGDRHVFDAVLAKVPDAEPNASDRID